VGDLKGNGECLVISIVLFLGVTNCPKTVGMDSQLCE
jgi:hypothetical protein